MEVPAEGRGAHQAEPEGRAEEPGGLGQTHREAGADDQSGGPGDAQPDRLEAVDADSASRAQEEGQRAGHREQDIGEGGHGGPQYAGRMRGMIAPWRTVWRPSQAPISCSTRTTRWT